jgi:hypothetical protein
VAKSTIDGMAVAWSCSQGWGGIPNHPITLLKTPVGDAS